METTLPTSETSAPDETDPISDAIPNDIQTDLDLYQTILHELDSDLTRLSKEVSDLRIRMRELEKQRLQEMDRLLIHDIEVAAAMDRIFANVQERQQRDPTIVTPEMERWLKNFRNIRTGLVRVLNQHGFEPIELPADRMFDPVWHKIIEQVDHETLDSDYILEVVQPGYWHPATGRILSKLHVKTVR